MKKYLAVPETILKALLSRSGGDNNLDDVDSSPFAGIQLANSISNFHNPQDGSYQQKNKINLQGAERRRRRRRRQKPETAVEEEEEEEDDDDDEEPPQPSSAGSNTQSQNSTSISAVSRGRDSPSRSRSPSPTSSAPIRRLSFASDDDDVSMRDDDAHMRFAASEAATDPRTPARVENRSVQIRPDLMDADTSTAPEPRKYSQGVATDPIRMVADGGVDRSVQIRPDLVDAATGTIAPRKLSRGISTDPRPVLMDRGIGEVRRQISQSTMTESGVTNKVSRASKATQSFQATQPKMLHKASGDERQQVAASTMTESGAGNRITQAEKSTSTTEPEKKLIVQSTKSTQASVDGGVGRRLAGGVERRRPPPVRRFVMNRARQILNQKVVVPSESFLDSSDDEMDAVSSEEEEEEKEEKEEEEFEVGPPLATSTPIKHGPGPIPPGKPRRIEGVTPTKSRLDELRQIWNKRIRLGRKRKFKKPKWRNPRAPSSASPAKTRRKLKEKAD